MREIRAIGGSDLTLQLFNDLTIRRFSKLFRVTNRRIPRSTSVKRQK
jgi:hypothetical protein